MNTPDKGSLADLIEFTPEMAALSAELDASTDAVAERLNVLKSAVAALSLEKSPSMHPPKLSPSEPVAASPHSFAVDLAVPAATSRPSPFAPWHAELLEAIRHVRRARGALLVASEIARKSGRLDVAATLMDRWHKLHEESRGLDPMYADALEHGEAKS